MKVSATLRITRDDAGVRYEVDYICLTGAKRSDCIQIEPGWFTGEDSLLYRAKQKLRDYLNAQYAPEVFGLSDIVLFG